MTSPSTCTQTPVQLLLLLLSLSATFHLLVAADSSLDGVLDSDGDKLKAGTKYYILPVVPGRGGGVTLGPRNPTHPTCPFDVVQDPSEVSNGLPVTFTPVKDSKNGPIRLSTDLIVKFQSVRTICSQSTVWRLDKYGGRYFISTGGVKGKPGRKTLSNLFNIMNLDHDYPSDKKKKKKPHHGYKLNYCPPVCAYCKVICKDVGIYIDEYGTRHLALSDEPFSVMFKKAAT